MLKTLFALALILMLFRWFEHSQVYHPSRTLDAQGGDLGRPFEDVIFKTSGGMDVNGWFFPAGTNAPYAQRVILFCHGNGGNISHRLDVYQTLLELGLNVFAFDYRGYGKSSGRPGEEGTYRDAQAAYAWLRQKGFAATNIIAYGESLGGGIASELCVREPMGGLILQSTFTSIPDIGAEFYPWLPVKLLSRIKYDTRNKLMRLKIPVLVMHSRTDSLIGFQHGERNFAAANEPKMFCELSGDHNDPMTNQAAFADGLNKFLELIEGLKAGMNLPVAK